MLNIDRILHKDEATDLADRIHAGQAHFGNTGPFGAVCMECKYWMHVGYYSKHGKNAGKPKDAECGKFRMLTRKNGPLVPHDASACKYFEEREVPIRENY